MSGASPSRGTGARYALVIDKMAQPHQHGSSGPTSRLGKLAALPAEERGTALEAAAALTLASAALTLAPFRRIAAWLGPFEAGETAAPVLPRTQATPDARRIGEAVERAARHLPWRPKCLAQALAACAMLRRRGVASTIHFGVRHRREAEKPMDAHAWLSTRGAEVVGLRASQGFTPIARFGREEPPTRIEECS